MVVRDISDEILKANEARLNKSLDKLVAKGKMDEAKKADILAHMSFTTDLNLAADADLVIEAATENPTIKKGIFTDLDGICKPETSWPPTPPPSPSPEIGAVTKFEQVIGMHFNPATVMKLVRSSAAPKPPTRLPTIAALASELGKEPVEVNEAPGFVVNKILIPLVNEGIDLVYTGVASVEATRP